MPHICEDELIQRFQTVIGRVLVRKPVVLAACQEAIHSLLEWDETELERLRQQADFSLYECFLLYDLLRVCHDVPLCLLVSYILLWFCKIGKQKSPLSGAFN